MSRATAEIHLANGESIVVEGDRDDVEKRLSDAARSGQSRLAWFTEPGRGSEVGVNPAHVVSLRAAEPSS